MIVGIEATITHRKLMIASDGPPGLRRRFEYVMHLPAARFAIPASLTPAWTRSSVDGAGNDEARAPFDAPKEVPLGDKLAANA